MNHLSLSNDELSGMARARFSSVSEVIRNGVYTDFHPAGVELFIYFWLRVFGDHPFLYRLPFVLCGIGCIPLIYWIGKRWFSGMTGLFTAVVFGFFQFTFLYSFFARPYSPGLLACLLAVYAWTRIFFPKVDSGQQQVPWFLWILWILSMSAATHIHYFSFVFVAVVGLTGLFLLRPALRIPYFFSGIVILLLFIPEWNIFTEQMKTGDIGGWLGSPGKGFLFDFIFYTFNKSWWIMIPVIAGFTLGIWKFIPEKKWTPFHSISLAWFLVSFGIAYGYSVLRHPVIQYSTLFFSFPFLLFFIFSILLAPIQNRSLQSGLLIVLLSGGLLSSVVDKKFIEKAPYGIFKDLAADLKEWTDKYGKEQTPSVINVANPEYIQYYFRKLDVDPQVFRYNIFGHHELAELAAELDTVHSDHFIFSWSNSDHPFELNKLIEEHYPVLEEKRIYFNCAAYLYAKKGKSVDQRLWSSRCDFESKHWGDEISVRTDEKSFLGRYSGKMDSTREFSPTLNLTLASIPGTDYRWITARAWFWTDDTLITAALVLQFDHFDKTVAYYAQLISDFNIQPGRWQEVIVSQLIPADFQAEDRMKVYVWNPDRNNFYIDEIRVDADAGDDPYKE